jgi:hypothetical protein
MFCHSSDFDLHMFRLVWRPVVSAISTAFSTLDDDYIVEKVITGFRDCATLASHFKLPEVFDFIVMSLAYSTGLAEEISFPRQSNFPVVEVDGQTITVSALSVRFGTSLRSQLATVVLFTILNGKTNHLRESWAPVGRSYGFWRTLELMLVLTRCLKCSKHSSCTPYFHLGCYRWRTSWAEYPVFQWLYVNLNSQPQDLMEASCPHYHHTS